MKLVLLSGGSGTRLWPLSTGVNSKQFLPVLRNKNGQIESVLQRNLRQVTAQGLLEDTYICTVEEQMHILTEQVKEISGRIIVEPKRRDTFPAIAMSVCELYDRGIVRLDEVVAVCPVDLYVEDAFYQAIKDAVATFEQTESDLMMIGVKPFYPTAKYGYIVPRSTGEVESFVEKPDRVRARELIAQGALWNSGFYAFRVEFILEYLRSQNLPVSASEFRAQYDYLPKCSFDYEVSEKVKSSRVYAFAGLWDDLGSWDTLVEVFDQQLIGKGSIYDDCSNVYVINQLDLPITVAGQTDLVIVACPEGILITDKILSNGLKEYVAKITAASLERAHDLTIIADNCSGIKVTNNSGIPLILIGLTDIKINCELDAIIIKAIK